MNFKEIDITQIDLNPFNKIGKDWFLVSSGKESSFNTMTASWGFMGVMWNKNCVITAIRPQRYTKEFVDNNELFTISFFSEEYRDALKFCGSHSGRDYDKMKETGFKAFDIENSVGFEQAELILVCKKLYNQDMGEENFIDKNLISANYPNNDYHTSYFGEIIKAYSK